MGDDNYATNGINRTIETSLWNSYDNISGVLLLIGWNFTIQGMNRYHQLLHHGCYINLLVFQVLIIKTWNWNPIKWKFNLIVIWGYKYLLSKRFSFLMNDESDMSNIVYPGFTWIFAILSTVFMNEYTDFAIQAVCHLCTYFILSTIA